MTSNALNCFKLVKSVLDELFIFVVEDIMSSSSLSKSQAEVEAKKIINLEVGSLQSKYSNLAKATQPIDYSKPETRFAYIYKYVATHASYVAQVIELENLLTRYKNRTSLDVTCIGGGPGSELVGVLKSVIGGCDSIQNLHAYLLDRVQDWGDSWSDIHKKTNLPIQLGVNFTSFDITKKSWSNHAKFFGSDLIILSYFASEISALATADTKTFFNDLYAKAKVGAILMIVDNNSPSFNSYINNEIIMPGWTVLNTAVGEMTPEADEQASAIGDYKNWITHNPKLKSKICYWVLEKS